MSLEKNKVLLTGYVTVRKFAGYALPVPAQNKLLKSYCQQNNFLFKLPMCELYLPDNYMALNATLKSCQSNANVGMCSVYMLPRSKKKINLISEIVNNKNISFHFIFEDKLVKPNDFHEFYHYSWIRYITSKSNKKFFINIYG